MEQQNPATDTLVERLTHETILLSRAGWSHSADLMKEAAERIAELERSSRR